MGEEASSTLQTPTLTPNCADLDGSAKKQAADAASQKAADASKKRMRPSDIDPLDPTGTKGLGAGAQIGIRFRMDQGSMSVDVSVAGLVRWGWWPDEI